MDHDRVPALKDLDIADTSVGDMGVDAGGAMPCWPCAGATSDGLFTRERYEPIRIW